MAEWTESQNKKLGWFYVVIAVITLVIAVVQQPIGDWGVFGWLIAAALLLLGITGLRQGMTGRGNTRSRNMTEAKQRQWAIVGLIGVTVAVIATVISSLSDWTASDTLVVGVWVALSGLFISQIRTLSAS